MEHYRGLEILYRNFRGEIAVRRIVPRVLWYGSTEWHPEPQFLLKALDLDKHADRDFAMKDILAWGREAIDAYQEAQRKLCALREEAQRG